MNTKTILTIGEVSILTTTPKAATIIAQLDDAVFVAKTQTGEYMEVVAPEVMPKVELIAAMDVLLQVSETAVEYNDA